MKFNQTPTTKTVNKSGYKAYSMSDKPKLVTQVVTSFFGESKFYGDNTSELVETAKRVISADPKFVANLARYTRKEMHLRSVSHFLTALVANTVAAKPFIHEVVNDVVERVDDITEILSAYINIFGKPIPNGLKKALNKEMNSFSAFSFSKYNGGNKQVKLRDILRICHTKPGNEEQSIIFKNILNDTLETAERWETELSANGNNKETWDRLIKNNRIGYMAALKNLRNMINANADIDPILNMLKDPEQIKKSKQLPFRFFSAYREIQSIAGTTNKHIGVLEQAIEHSIVNLPKIPGKTFIGLDVSGSMTSAPISEKSTIMPAEIGAIIAAIANRLCEESVIYTFDTKIRKYTVLQQNGILATAKMLQFDGGGTDTNLPIKEMLNNKIYADRLIMLSDNEINNYRGFARTGQPFTDEYRRTINPNLWIHAIDLQGYGTQQFIGFHTNIIAGWSEKIIEFIMLAENNIENQVTKIENYR